MMCDECGQNQATVHIATIIGGNKKDENLCAQCWQKRNAQLLGGLAVGDLLSKLLGAKPQAEQPEQQEDEEGCDLTCPGCGMSFAEFQKTGKVGCAGCYAAFGDKMEQTLKSIHGHARHVGKVPEYLAGEMNAQRRLDDLRRQMDAAVAEEDFERAAALRDEIKALNLTAVAQEMKEAHRDE